MYRHQIGKPPTESLIIVQPGILRQLGLIVRPELGNLGINILLVTDERVSSLYGNIAGEALRSSGQQVANHVIHVGEESKSVVETERVFESLARHRVGRDGLILALGGGVVSDLAGFAASVWMRGIRWAICPTTLEAAIDASIGGKTAINLPGGKNLVGSFHWPKWVAIDPACLRTLDSRDVRAGLAESVKHALISSPGFLSWHEENVDAILALEEPVIMELIQRNVQIKGDIVTRDPDETTGVRMRLNLGHTIGHAIEECIGFRLRHGECVAIGLVAACRLSQRSGLLKQDVVMRVENLLRRFELPANLPEPIAVDSLLEAMSVDKKTRGGSVRFVFLEDVGRPIIRDDVSKELIREVCDEIQP